MKLRPSRKDMQSSLPAHTPSEGPSFSGLGVAWDQPVGGHDRLLSEGQDSQSHALWVRKGQEPEPRRLGAPDSAAPLGGQCQHAPGQPLYRLPGNGSNVRPRAAGLPPPLP